ncbi:MAG: hypothetical protein AAFR61_09085 [Bacteroidota bacterium]
MIKKDAILKALAEFPDEVSVEDFIDRLLLLQKIEKGMAQSQKGETLSEEEARNRIK